MKDNKEGHDFLYCLLDRKEVTSFTDMEPFIHWTGLFLLPYHDVDTLKDQIDQRLKSLSLLELDRRKKVWDEYQEAQDFLVSFWEWWRNKTYPERVYGLKKCEEIKSRQGQDGILEEHKRLARQYIVDYQGGLDILSADRLTELVPKAMRNRVRESLVVYSAFRDAVEKEQWEKREPTG